MNPSIGTPEPEISSGMTTQLAGWLTETLSSGEGGAAALGLLVGALTYAIRSLVHGIVALRVGRRRRLTVAEAIVRELGSIERRQGRYRASDFDPFLDEWARGTGRDPFLSPEREESPVWRRILADLDTMPPEFGSLVLSYVRLNSFFRSALLDMREDRFIALEPDRKIVFTLAVMNLSRRIDGYEEQLSEMAAAFVLRRRPRYRLPQVQRSNQLAADVAALTRNKRSRISPASIADGTPR